MGCAQQDSRSANCASTAQHLAYYLLSFLTLALVLSPLASAAVVTFEVRNPLLVTILGAPANSYIVNTDSCSGAGPACPPNDTTNVVGQLTAGYARTCAPLGTYQARANFTGLAGETASTQSPWQNIYTSVCSSPTAMNDTGTNYCFAGNVWRSVLGCDLTACGWGSTTPGDANDYIVQTCASGCYVANATCIGAATNTSAAPTILLNAPANASTIVAGTLLQFTVTAPLGVSTVRYSLDGAANVTLLAPFNATNINTAGWAPGNRTLLVYANDTGGNLSSALFVFTLADTTPPVVLYTPLTPDNNTVVPASTFLIDVVASKPSLSGVVKLNGVNFTMLFITSTHFQYNASNLTNGNYTFRAFVNDTSNNTGAADQRTVTVAAPAPALAFVAPTPANASLVNTPYVFINVTSSKPLGTALLEFNGTNSTMNVSGSLAFANVSGLPSGTYLYRVYANDTANNWNATGQRTVTVDLVAPILTLVPPSPANGTLLFVDNVTVNLTSSKPLSTALLSLNGANSTMNGSGTLWNLTTGFLFGGNSYTYQVFGNDTAGNFNSTAPRTVTIAAQSWLNASTVNGFFYASILTNTVLPVFNSNLTSSMLANSTVNDSRVNGSNLTNSTVYNNVTLLSSSLANCVANTTGTTITSSVCSNSWIDPSNVTGSQVVNGSSVQGSNVTNSILNATQSINSSITSSNLFNTLVTLSALTGVTASGAVLTNSTASGSTLTASTVMSSTATNSTLTNSTVLNSTLVNATATNATITNSTLTNVTVINSTVANLVLVNVQIINGVIVYNNASLSGFVFYGNGTAAGGANVTINGTGLSTLTNSTGVYSFPSVANSTYNVTAFDGAGFGSNTTQVTLLPSASMQLNFTLQNTIPAVTFVAVTPNPTNASASIQLRANATNGLPITSMNVTLNGTPYPLAFNATSGLWENLSATAPNNTGVYPVNAAASNTLGVIGSNGSVSLTVIDAVPPTVPSVTLAPSTANASQAGLLLTANATDNVAVTTVNATLNGVTYPLALNATAGLWQATITAPNLTGVFPVNVTARDSSGNTGSNASVNLLVVDNIPPVVSSVSVVPNLVGINASINITANASDNVGLAQVVAVINGVTYNLTFNGTVWRNTTATSPAAGGNYTVNVTATDSSGNTGSNASVNLTVNANPPVISLVAIAPNPANASQAGLTVLANVTAVGVVTSVNATINGTNYLLALSGGLWTNASVTAPRFTGSFAVNVTARDNSGNWASSATTLLTVVDQVPPVVNFVNASVNPANAASTIILFANATDNGFLASASAILNGVTYPLAFNATSGLWQNGSVSVPSALGNYTINATFLDTAGNSGSNATYVLTVNDITPPSVYFVNVAPNPTNGSIVTILANVSDNAGVAGVNVTIGAGAAIPMVNTSGQWQAVGVAPGAGGLVNVSARDTSSNLGTNATITLVVATGAPNVSSVTLTPNPVNASSSVLVKVNATDTTTNVTAVNVTLNNATTPLAFNATTGLWQATLTAPNTTAAFVVNATARNTVGNTGSNASTVLTVVDGVPPLINSVTASPNPANVSSSVMVGVNATDNVAVTTVNATLNGVTYPLAFNATSGLWQATVAVPSVLGVYIITANASDAAGNLAGNNTATLTVVDGVPPVVVFVLVTPNPVLQGQNVTVRANATDNVNVSAVNVTIGALPPAPMAFNTTSGLWEAIAASPAVLGVYVVNVSARDTSGNLGTNTSVSLIDGRAPNSTGYSVNGTTLGTFVQANASWFDDQNLSGFVFSQNASGAFVNGTFTAFSGTANVSSAVFGLPGAAGVVVGWVFYANDSNGNFNQTPVQTLVTALPGGLSNLTNTWFDGVYYASALVGASAKLVDSNLTNVVANDSTTRIFDSRINSTTLVNSNVSNFSTLIGPNTITTSSINNCTIITVNLTGISCFASFIDPSNVTNSMVAGGSLVIESNVSGSQVVNASQVYYSNVANSVLNSSAANFSNVTNSNLFASAVLNSSVTNAVLWQAAVFNTTFSGGAINSSTVNSSASTNSQVVNGSTVVNGTLTGSAVNASTVTNSVLSSSSAYLSMLTNSTLTNSIAVNATIANSVVTNSNITNAAFTGANVTGGVLVNGTISFFNVTCNCTSTYNASASGPLPLANATNYPPVVSSAVSSTTTPTTSTAVTFTATASDPNIPGPLNDSLTYTWNFGNGATLVNGPVVVYTYPAVGTFTPSVTVTDKYGGSASFVLAPVTVGSPPAPAPAPAPTPTPAPSGGGGPAPVFNGNSGGPPLPLVTGGGAGSTSQQPAASPTPLPEQRASESGEQTLRLGGEPIKVSVTRTLVSKLNPRSPTGWTTTVTLFIVNNGSARLEDFLVRDEIPIAFATDPLELTFNFKPLYFEKGSIIAVWKVGFLNPKDTLVLEYSVDKFIPASYLALFKPPRFESTRQVAAPTAPPLTLASPTPSPPAPGVLTGLFTAAGSPIGLAVVALILLGILVVVFTRPKQLSAAPEAPKSPQALKAELKAAEREEREARQHQDQEKRAEKQRREEEKRLAEEREKLEKQARDLEEKLQKARERLERTQKD